MSPPVLSAALALVLLAVVLALVVGPRECSDAWLHNPGTDARAPLRCATPTDDTRHPPDLRGALLVIGALGALLVLALGRRARLAAGTVTVVLLVAVTALNA